MARNATKSPLKSRPLNSAGQSLDQQIQDQLVDKALPLVMLPLVLAVFAIIEWFKWYTNAPPQPGLASLIAIAFASYSAWRLKSVWRDVKNLKLGRDGERAVGEYLERLRSDGANVFHDITGDGFNVDHVVVSPKGIFAIETKTCSKRAKGQSKISFDGEKLLVNGRPIARDPITQARAAANHVRQVVEESTGKSFPVKPVVLFPGWYIDHSGKPKGFDTWVLEPKAFPKFLATTTDQIGHEDIRLVSYHLSRHIRMI